MTSEQNDVSPSGVRKPVLDERLQPVVSTTSVGYFQPQKPEVNMQDVVAIRMRLTFCDVEVWDDDMVEEIQLYFGPRDCLSAVEVALIVSETLGDIKEDLVTHYQTVADFVNDNARAYSDLQRVIIAVIGNRGLGVSKPGSVVMGDSNETTIEGSDISSLRIEHLRIIAKIASRVGGGVTDAITVVLGAALFAVDPVLAASLDPFATAVETARLERLAQVNKDVVQKAMNYDSSVEAIVETGEIYEQAVFEVIRVSDLSYDHLNYLTDQVFTDGELEALGANALDEDDYNLDDLASAKQKLKVAVASDDIDWVAMANRRGDDEENYKMYEGVGSWSPIAVIGSENLGKLSKCAFFFYGRSNTVGIDSDQPGDTMFAYTSAVGFPVPNPTIGGAAALLRDSTATAKGSVIARLEVESFIRAYHAFLGVLIREHTSMCLEYNGGGKASDAAAD